MLLQQACRPDSCLASGKHVSVFLACLSVSLSNVPFIERDKIRACVTLHSVFHGVTKSSVIDTSHDSGAEADLPTSL